MSRGISSIGSVAVIGASHQPEKLGYQVFHNVLTQGFKGAVFPINPKGGEIEGQKVYESINTIVEQIDLAVVVTPAPTVCAIAQECAAKGVKIICVISAGFSETHTEEGKAMERELTQICKEANMLLVGPNCLGLLVPGIGLNASFAKSLPAAGGIALVSQSGAMAVALIDQAQQLGIGFSTILSIGNKAANDEVDFLNLLAADPSTKVIGLYLENIDRGRAFLEAARFCNKPVVLLKGGTTEAGRKAAASHTGAMAGGAASLDALCAASGVHRAHTSEDFLILLQTLSTQPQLVSNRIAVITNAGGPGILAADSAVERGLQLPALTPAVEKALRAKLPASAATGNPIDVIGDALTDRYQAAFDACSDDPNIDGVVVLLTPQTMTPVEEIAGVITSWKREHPLTPVTACFFGGDAVQKGQEILTAGNVVSCESPEDAVMVMSALRKVDPAGAVEVPVNAKRQKTAHAIVASTRGLLDPQKTAELFALYDIPFVRGCVAHSPEEAVAIANEIGYPVIAKVDAPGILHKTDVGGVVADIQDADAVRNAYERIVAAVTAAVPNAAINGVLVQQYLPAGHEFIIGGLRDAACGPLVMAGLGGIYTELFADTVFRLAPLTEKDAYEMLTKLLSWELLLGMRGKAQSDVAALAIAIERISLLLHECPQIMELDCNPVLVRADGVTVVDGKIVCS